MSLLSKITPTSNNPTRSVEWVIAVSTFIGGLYIFTPLYNTSVAINGLSAMATTFSDPFMILFWGALLLLGSVAVIYGLIRKNLAIKSIGWFSIILARLFQLFTTFLVTGIFPISWIYPATITAVVVVLWLSNKLEIRDV